MIDIAVLTFNPFQENTIILSDETKECIIIDPGCYNSSEQSELRNYIQANKLKPVKLVNTHAHVDHIMGNRFVSETFNLKPLMHQYEMVVLDNAAKTAVLYGINLEEPPMPGSFIDEGDFVEFGNSQVKVIFTPGHSPGSVSFYNEGQKFLIGGDVLFRSSIGRTDLPGGDFNTLIKSIKTKLLTLPDEVTVYPGHGPETTIRFEKEHNAFL